MEGIAGDPGSHAAEYFEDCWESGPFSIKRLFSQLQTSMKFEAQNQWCTCTMVMQLQAWNVNGNCGPHTSLLPCKPTHNSIIFYITIWRHHPHKIALFAPRGLFEVYSFSWLRALLHRQCPRLPVWTCSQSPGSCTGSQACRSQIVQRTKLSTAHCLLPVERALESGSGYCRRACLRPSLTQSTHRFAFYPLIIKSTAWTASHCFIPA